MSGSHLQVYSLQQILKKLYKVSETEFPYHRVGIMITLKVMTGCDLVFRALEIQGFNSQSRTRTWVAEISSGDILRLTKTKQIKGR